MHTFNSYKITYNNIIVITNNIRNILPQVRFLNIFCDITINISFTIDLNTIPNNYQINK